MKGHYSDVIGCKIHLQKLIAFLITRSKSWKFNLNIPFTIVAISKIKKNTQDKPNKSYTGRVWKKLTNTDQNFKN